MLHTRATDEKGRVVTFDRMLVDDHVRIARWCRCPIDCEFEDGTSGAFGRVAKRVNREECGLPKTVIWVRRPGRL